MNFLHYFHPSAIAFSFGPISIHYYGLLMCLAFVVAIIVVVQLDRRQKILPPDGAYELVFWLIVCGLLGARLYEVFILNWPYYASHPEAMVKIWQGGLAIHGAIIGGLIALGVFAKVKKINFWRLADLVAPALILGQAIGRWGNYFNQELFGWPTSWPWGIFIEPLKRPVAFVANDFFQPAFLYESILDLLLFFVLLILARRACRPGLVSWTYFAGYALIRFVLEFVRIDETALMAGFRLPQLVSGVVFVVALAILWKVKGQK